MKWLALVFAFVGSFANAQTLRIGLAEDPDVLDPSMARTFVGRIVFAGLCDKLFDLDEKLNIVPQLATSHEWSGDNKALTIKPDYGDAMTYKGLLLRLAANLEKDPAKQKQLLQQADDLRKKGEDIQKAQTAAAAADKAAGTAKKGK